jgi:chemosensory pili system protein ChpA (sensor histidine kinase/response regulator)
MTSLSGIDAALPAPAAYLAQLDTLVSLLRAANAMPGMGDAVLLEPMVDALQRDAAALPLPGVAELLRSWQAALRDLARADGTPSEDDLVRMTLWFTGLQEHLAGRLDRDGRRMLAELPEGIRWLPKLSPGFVHAISRRLELSSPQPAASSTIATPPPVAEPPSVEASGIEAADVGPTDVEPEAADTADGDVASAPADAEAPAFAFDAPAIDIEPASDAALPMPPDMRAAVDAFAHDDAHDDVADTAAEDDAAPATLWIGREELDLTRQAIAEQVLPLAQAWAEAVDAGDTTAAAGHVVELTYQTQLIANVMALIGTPTLERGVLAVNEGLERGDPAIGPDTVATWCSALLGVLETPGRDAGELLALVSDGIPGLDADWAAALGDELDRVTVGLDPALIAQRKTVAEFDDIGLAPADDVLPSVLEGMYRELPGNAARFGASVRALVDTRSPEPIDEARRVAHTLKGDANTVGIRGLANLTHALEDILLVLNKHPERLDDACADLLTTASDTVEEIADHLLGRGPAPDHLLDIYQQVLDTANALADDATPPGEATARAADTAHDAPAATPSPRPAAAESAPAETAAGGMAASGIQSLNVPSALLDELQRLSGEGLVTSRQIDQQLDGLGAIHREQRQSVRSAQDLIARLDDLVALRGAALQSTAQKAGAELDPLEIDQYNELHVISRQLLESHADSAEFMRRIERIMNALAELRSGQEQLNRDLQRTILRTRTVPFGQIAARLQRIVRQTAKQVFKPVRLDIVGEEIPVDAELLERIVEPLAHLLRNAVDHGIEPPAVRTAAGKPETGVLTLRVGLQGDAALIELQDDGAGLDLVAIRKRAIEAGLLEAHHAIDERTLARMILLPGFSTRTETTEVSGRGIGMDVVERRIAALRGTLTLSTETGRGTRVQLRLPVTQTLANVIVARGQRQPSAVVAASIERVVSFGAGECREVDGRLVALVDGETVPALPIEAFYGETADPAQWAGGGIGLYLRDADGLGHVVVVRGIDEVRSVVVKPLAAYLPPIPAVRGITQLGDGGLAPVIDLDVLLRAARERRFDIAALAHDTVPVQRVVVADDSLSVRRALEQLMQDAGFEVTTARDGFEALAAVQAKPTQALLIDLEMPRMNGLEVTRNLRNHAETRDLPVVMITSRATDKHRAMAEEAGVTRLLGKPFAEDALVALVRELIAAQ